MDFLIKICIIMFVLLTHEFGHYFEMIKYGIKVKEISIGVGPIILKRRMKNGIFYIRLIPVLAYVMPQKHLDAQTKGSKIRLKNNIKIYLAGVKVNFILGIIVYLICYFAYLHLDILYMYHLYTLIDFFEYLNLFCSLSISCGILNLIPLFVTNGAKSLNSMLKIVLKSGFLVSLIFYILNIAGIITIIVMFKCNMISFIL